MNVSEVGKNGVRLVMYEMKRRLRREKEGGVRAAESLAEKNRRYSLRFPLCPEIVYERARAVYTAYTAHEAGFGYTLTGLNVVYLSITPNANYITP